MRRAALVLGLSVVVAACSAQPPPETARIRAPLYDNLGSHSFGITTQSPDAQKYFNQGFILSYAFNHAEAIRAFREAAEIDPTCAMCSWGVAFALGPNINAPITLPAAKEAYAAIEEAQRRAGGATERERGYIEALATRYSSNPEADRTSLDRAYADAMRDLARRFPDDLDAATLFAQSLMDTSPWNYWTSDGKPRSFTNQVLGQLESVLARKPDHPGAIHLYIHAVEASPDPGRAAPYADRLLALVPGAGHLVHMPAHIYLRTGRFHAASRANEEAIKADEAYFAGTPVPDNMMYAVGYYPHNMHFLVTSASMEGRRVDALRAADNVRARMHEEMLRDPGMGGMVQHMYLTPLFTKVRFALWEDVLAEALPPADLPYMAAMSNAARALAFTASGRLAEAEKERAALARRNADPALKSLMISNVNTAAANVAIAHDIVSAELAAARREVTAARHHYARAVVLEDGMTYMEPPDWPIPVRELQGATLLSLGRPAEAERAFRDDLRKFPDNGWSLSGLAASLDQQGRQREAAEVSVRLATAWARADTPLSAARTARGDRR